MSSDPADQADQAPAPAEAPSPQASPIEQALRRRRTQQRFAEALTEKLESVDTGLRRWAIANIKDERPAPPTPAPLPPPKKLKPYADRLSERLHKK